MLEGGVASVFPELYRARSQRLMWDAGSPRAAVVGYVDRHSVAPGETFHVMLSTRPGRVVARGRIEVRRVGHYGEERDRETVWSGPAVEVPQQWIRQSSASTGFRWTPVVRDVDTSGWRSGYHTIDFVPESGERIPDVAFVVVRAAEPRGAVLVKLGTNTYQAYNRWGGFSLYATPLAPGAGLGGVVSFDRPGENRFFGVDYYFVRWIEKLAAEHSFSVDYATNFDFHRDADIATPYDLLVVVGHDEYWSARELDQVQRRIFEQGGNTMFLGANIAYWQVRYADVDGEPGGESRGRQLVCHKSTDDPIRHRSPDPRLWTARLREEGRRPELEMMGVAYCENCAFASDRTYPYRVVAEELPFFHETGLEAGDIVAEVIGHEWDNTDPASLGSPEAEPVFPLTVVLRGNAVDHRGRERVAEAVWFETPAGARVFSAGTVRWAWGLGKPGIENDAFRRLNRNLVLDLLGRSD